jgi:hypothetical protein
MQGESLAQDPNSWTCQLKVLTSHKDLVEFDIQNQMLSMYSGIILPIIYETIRDQEWPYKSKKNWVTLMITFIIPKQKGPNTIYKEIFPI